MEHNLLKKNGQWECTLCEWAWGTKPQSACLGIPRYYPGCGPNHLLSQTELNKAGFKLAPKQKARAFAQNGRGDKYDLYDIYEAEKKPRTTWEPKEGIERLRKRRINEERRSAESELKNGMRRILDSLDALINSNNRYFVQTNCTNFKNESQKMRFRLEQYRLKYTPQPRSGDVVVGNGEATARSGDVVVSPNTFPVDVSKSDANL